MSEKCPLCFSESTDELNKEIFKRKFIKCDHCWLIFIKRCQLPNEFSEKERYSHHHNESSNSGYLNFLNQILHPSLDHLKKEMKILDFGCGPNPVLASVLKSKGFDCNLYDPFYYPEKPTITYDYIFTTECVEHFHNPGLEFEFINSLLYQGAYLAIMTEMWTNIDSISEWYYARDFTHVAFYHQKTFKFLASSYDMKIVYTDGKRCLIFKKES